MRHRLKILFPLALLLMCCWHIPTAAQTGGGYALGWSTIDSGGNDASGGGFELNGTVGQHDAGTLSGGGFQLSGGFWQANSSVPTAVALNPNLTANRTATPYALIGLLSLCLALLSLRIATKQTAPTETSHAA